MPCGGTIRQFKTSTASIHDSRHFEGVLDPHNTNLDVCADKAYTSAEREALMKRLGYRNHIKRKGQQPNHPLSTRPARRNKRIARTRARVEHVFGVMAQRGASCCAPSARHGPALG